MQIEPPPHTGLYSKYLQILTYSVLTSTPRGSHVYSHSPPGTEAWTSEGFSPGSPARESATLCHLLPRLSEAEGLSVSQMRGGLKEVKIGAEKEEVTVYQTEVCWRESRREWLRIWGLFLFGQNGGCLGTCSGMGRPELTLAPQHLPDHPSNSSVCLSLIPGA